MELQNLKAQKIKLTSWPILISAVVIVLIVGIGIGIGFKFVSEQSFFVGSGTGSGEKELPAEFFPTRKDAPSNVHVPEPDETPGDTNVAVPIRVDAAGPNTKAKYRVFRITIEGGVYNPSTVIVNAGDGVEIQFTSADETYDTVLPDYGLTVSEISKGQTVKKMIFTAQHPGTYTFSCQRFCPKGKMEGTLIVAE